MQKIFSLQIKGLHNVASFVEGQAILRSADNATGVIVKGSDAGREDLETYQKHLVFGKLDFRDETIREERRKFFFFKTTTEKKISSIFLGEVLARQLHVQVGDRVTLIAPFHDPALPFSLMHAETRLFVIKGIFRIGMNDFDSAMVIIPIAQAQGLYHLGARVTGLSLRFKNVDDSEKWKYRMRETFGLDYSVRSWYDMNHNFFQALRVEKSVMTILLALIILVAAFNIVSTLTMIVMEKTKDIGILRAIGATRAHIRNIFVIEGFSIGFFGVIGGAILGLLLAFNLNPVSDFLKNTTGLEVFPSDIYFFDRIPAEVHPEDVSLTVIFALLAAIFAAFYPAHRASKLSPLEALRYE